MIPFLVRLLFLVCRQLTSCNEVERQPEKKEEEEEGEREEGKRGRQRIGGRGKRKIRVLSSSS